MFKIKETSHEGIIFPNKEDMQNYEDYDFASLISVLGVHCIIGGMYYKIGDSNINVEINQTEKRNKEGMEELKEYAIALVEFIRKAIPQMSKPYAEYYEHYLEDYDKNGLTMPFYGKVL